MEKKITINNIHIRAMHSNNYMKCTSYKYRDWYKNRIVRPNMPKKPLVQGHPVVFGQNISYIR